MKNTGKEFEEQAYQTLKRLLIDDALGLSAHHCQIFKHKRYFSRDRGSDTVFDVAIELALPGAGRYSLLWLWECKDYAHAVPVDDVEEFYAKTQQVAGANLKAGIITSASLQEGALAFAESKGISVVRLLPESQVIWVSYLRSSLDRDRDIARKVLLAQNYVAENNDCFVFCDGKFFDDPIMFTAHVYGISWMELMLRRM